MQNNIDYREIVQTVTSNVVMDVKNQLASMQPGIVDDIVKRVQSSLQTSLDSITHQLADMQQRLAQVEQKNDSCSLTPTPVQTPSASGTTNTSSAHPQMDTQMRVMLLKIQDSIKITWGGWIIYRVVNNGHFGVLMIRLNGTDKKDITKYFQADPAKFSEVIENGSDLIVKYQIQERITLCSGPKPQYKSEYAVIPKP